MDIETAQEIAKTVNDNIDELPAVQWESGQRKMKVWINRATAWSPKDRPSLVRVYFNLDIVGDKRHAPKKVFWDGDELQFQYGSFCDSGEKRSEVNYAMGELQEALDDLFSDDD